MKFNQHHGNIYIYNIYTSASQVNLKLYRLNSLEATLEATESNVSAKLLVKRYSKICNVLRKNVWLKNKNKKLYWWWWAHTKKLKNNFFFFKKNNQISGFTNVIYSIFEKFDSNFSKITFKYSTLSIMHFCMFVCIFVNHKIFWNFWGKIFTKNVKICHWFNYLNNERSHIKHVFLLIFWLKKDMQ